jgi:hypothetical protein
VEEVKSEFILVALEAWDDVVLIIYHISPPEVMEADQW